MDSNEQDKQHHIKNLFNLAVHSRTKAHCPYSKFAVGAALLAANGKIYTGCNVENAVNGMSLCAEGTAIVKMVQDGCKQIRQVFVVTGLQNQPPGAPCGLCRQHLKEFSADDSQLKVYLSNLDGNYVQTSLAELLPRSFGPKQVIGSV